MAWNQGQLSGNRLFDHSDIRSMNIRDPVRYMDEYPELVQPALSSAKQIFSIMSNSKAGTPVAGYSVNLISGLLKCYLEKGLPV